MNTVITGGPTSPLPATRTGALLHINQLDALRAFAVSSVMLAHYFPELNQFGEWGAMGVNLFFVISGFLITGILLKCKKQAEAGQSVGLTLRQFYARRFLRIFPLYYLVIFLAVLFHFSDVRQELWWYLTYTANYYGVVTGKWIGLSHFWTLALEEQFYLVWPILILFVPRRRLLLVPLIAILIGPAARVVIFASHINVLALMTTPVCLDTLGWGALLAVCCEMRLHMLAGLLARAGLWIGLPLLIILKVIEASSLPHHRLATILFNIGIGLFSVWLISGTVEGFSGIAGRMLDWRPLRYLGAISYGLYVYHFPVVIIVSSWLSGEVMTIRLLRAGICSLLTVLLAALSWHLFEHPINRLKRFFPYRLKSEVHPIQLETQRMSVG